VKAWPQVRIEHVESEAAGTLGKRLGSALTVWVSVSLGELTRDDVVVEVVYGRPDEDDQIEQPAYATLTAEPAPTAPTAPVAASGSSDPPAPPGVVRYSGEVPLDRPGPFGYTVRVLPWHPLLDTRAELGLVTYPQAPAGMTNGDLR